jgi:DNA-binding NarL/FixJ family response regulator
MKQDILIVDDSPIIRYALKAMIADLSGHNVVGEAENGEQAIEQINATNPSLVLLDIHMPILDGEDVLKAINSNKIKFLALSGVNDKSRIAALFGAGINGFLSKDDVTPSELEKCNKCCVC